MMNGILFTVASIDLTTYARAWAGCSRLTVSLRGRVAGLIVLLLAGCASPRGHETDALGGSIGKAQQSAVATGMHIQSAQKVTQQIEDELQELLTDSEP